MSISNQDIKEFDDCISSYEGLIPAIYDENFYLRRITEIAQKNKKHTSELCKIIIRHLKNDVTKFKLRLFNIIDFLFKQIGKQYINILSDYLYIYFKECFTMSDFEDRILLFKIFYTWKYLVPKNILDKIREDLKLDDFKEMFMRKYPGKIEKYDEYNEQLKSKLGNNNPF